LITPQNPDGKNIWEIEVFAMYVAETPLKLSCKIRRQCCYESTTLCNFL
jgi:hypothetical protein